jgi:type I restriction enzyme, S subunit
MKAKWLATPFEDCIEKVTYTTKIQRKDFLDEGEFPIVSQEESFINGYWNDAADVFSVATPIVIFGDHTKVLKYIDFDFVLGADGVKLLPPKAFLLPKFFYYQLQSVNLDSLGYARHYKLLRALELRYPPLPEQQRIVTLLDDAFDGIATAKANAEKNLQNARGIFESHLQSVFTQVDQNWTVKKLGDASILKIIDGDRGSNYPSKEDFFDDGFCLFLNTKNVRPDGFNFDTTMFISEEKDKALRKGKLKRSDVILTTRGTIGNVAIYDEDVSFENIRINSGMLIFRPNTQALLPSFLFEVFRSGIMRSQMEMHASGAAQPQLPIKTLVNFEIPIPKTLDAQRNIVLSVREIDHESQRLESIYQHKLTALEELKKSLLHRALSGEL